MKTTLRTRSLAAIALISGLVVLAGYFFKLPWLTGLRSLLLGWVAILAAAAVWMGVFNLARVHWQKITSRHPNRVFSLVLLAVLIATLTAGLIDQPAGKWTGWIYSSVILPVEISLLAGLAVTLGLLASQMIGKEWSWFRAVLLAAALVTMLGMTAWQAPSEFPIIASVQHWLTQALAVGGARGLLIGVAIGATVAGLRAIVGIDRPYRGS